MNTSLKLDKMTSSRKRKCVVLLLCLCCTNLWAVVWRVPGDYSSIQSAIEASDNGDTVLVAPGRYMENVNFLGKDITLTSTDPNDANVVASTIIDANGTGTVVTLANGETRQAVLTGFTITGGMGTYDPEFPGKLYLGSTNKIYLAGGILCSYTSPSIIGNVIEENHIPAVITPAGGRETDEKIDGFGGGIVCDNSSALIQGNVIRNNSASIGGGLYTFQGTAQVNGNKFYSNRTDIFGGAMFLHFDRGITSNNLCFDNHSQVYAGGLLIMGGTTVINNTFIANSSSTEEGGNLFSYNTTHLPDFSPLVLVNNIIAQAPSGYGSCMLGSHPHDVIANNNVWGNQPANYCNVWNNEPGMYYNETLDYTGLNGNISMDPGFVDAAAWDYHLRADSPCIDAGTMVPAVASLAFDIDGQTRLVAESVDIGADEYPIRRLLARVGDNQYLSRPQTVILDGSASTFIDPDGPKLFQWTQIQGQSVKLVGADTAIASFDPPSEGQYRFELIVSDGTQQSAPAQTWVTVANHAPLAQCPDRLSGLSVGEEIVLDGSNSYDPDGGPVTYQWHQLEGPAVDIVDSQGSVASFTASQIGTYSFSLVVNDGLLSSEPAEIEVIVGNAILVADPGKAIYVYDEPVSLNGLGSYDPHGLLGVDLGYHWRQLSGPTLQIDDPNSPTPTISGMVLGESIQRCLFELVVDDGSDCSDPATVEVVIVEDFGDHKLNQTNPPFDPSKPTIVVFEGGDCINGSPWNRFNNTIWSQNANIFTASYTMPFYKYGDYLIVHLSQVAPDYDQPIQTMGLSTGALIATDIALRLNCVYGDPRYAANRISYLDGGCLDIYGYSDAIARLRTENLTGESCWIDNYYSNGFYYRDTLNVRFPVPPANHGTPADWVNGSYNRNLWPNDYFNDGLYGGYYVSLCGEAKNLVLADDSSDYFFQWLSGPTPYLIHHDASQFPARLPEPVTLLDPIDPGDANSVILTCQMSRNAVGYELLMGTDPSNVRSYQVLSDTPDPPDCVLKDLPTGTAFWTIRARDAYGSTIHADPHPICRAGLSWPIENQRTAQRFTSIQTAIERSEDGDILVIRPGLYYENIDYGGKAITLRSIDSNDPNIIATTIIHSALGVLGPVVVFDDGESIQSRLVGLSIFGGSEGIELAYAQATIENCWILKSSGYGISMLNSTIILLGSVISDHEGSGIKMAKVGRGASSATLDNCTIANNGSYGIEGGQPELSHCVVAENRLGGLSCDDGSLMDCIVYYNGPLDQPIQLIGNISAIYSNIQGTWPGENNIDTDPQFNCLRRDCPGLLLVGERIILQADYE